jgi:hypothetical protein
VQQSQSGDTVTLSRIFFFDWISVQWYGIIEEEALASEGKADIPEAEVWHSVWALLGRG